MQTVGDRITDKSCGDFVDALASKAPVPGGGGAAAIVGAVGMALGGMVGSLTLGKQKYAEVQDEIIRLKSSADKLQQELLDMVDEDAKVFEPLSIAYGLPSSTKEEQAEKERVMETALKAASEVPFHIMESVLESIDVIERFSKIGTKIAISDAGCAAACCKAALSAASLNVFINTRRMKNREYAEQMNKRAEELLQLGTIKADAIFDTVRDELM